MLQQKHDNAEILALDADDQMERIVSYTILTMPDTEIPLSVAYINAKGEIVQISDMQPNTKDLHCADQDVLYALEANVGWFEKNNVTVGTEVNKLVTYDLIPNVGWFERKYESVPTKGAQESKSVLYTLDSIRQEK